MDVNLKEVDLTIRLGPPNNLSLKLLTIAIDSD